MGSIRRRLQHNANDSKNTRMDVGSALTCWKPDELGHISRYCKIADLIVEESRRLGRPIDLLEAGCGQVWVLRHLYRARMERKRDIVRSYLGVDIDPAILDEIPGWSAATSILDSGWLTAFSGRVHIQDLTMDARFDCEDRSVDVFWSTEVIEHMKPQFVEAWIADAHRCLRPLGLAYVSTPNHDGSNAVLPLDHVYEWGHEELKTMLRKRFDIVAVAGVFIQMPKFRRAQRELQRWPDEVVGAIEERFSPEWARVILATAYPEWANNAAFVLRRRG